MSSTPYLDAASARGREFLGTRHAIMAGAMTWVSERHLVSAISNAGGFGVIACGSMPPAILEAEIVATRALTDKPFGVNLITLHPMLDELIQVCARQQVTHVVLAGGLPSGVAIAAIKAFGAKLMCFAPTAALAKKLVRSGVDAIVIEGSEAGGHIGPVSLSVLAQEILPVITEVPVFVAGGMKRELVPGRWQMAVETFTGFIDDMLEANIGKEGHKYLPYIFSLFMFILFGNLLGLLPIGVLGLHPFTFTSHFTVTGVLAVLSFSIVLIVGFWKHGLKFFTLFVPHGTPLPMIPIIFPIELISFLVRPFSLALRLFVAMMAGHVLLKVLSSFVMGGINAGVGFGLLVSLPSFALMIGISALEILVAGIQAYVFALLTSLYINDAEHLH
jgi:F-type H+-transporting ATPase subunit a